MTGRPLVLYHGPSCQDGWTSAWVAHRHFGDTADYLSVQYGDPPPDVTGRKVYILDFSWKRSVIDQMATSAELITILDHHVTAQEDLAAYVRLGTFTWIDEAGKHHGISCTFDMAKCGARLTWEHFFPGEQAPWLIDLVEDRDLGRLWNPAAGRCQQNSREINAWLSVVPYDFEEWNVVADCLRDYNLFSQDVTRMGAAILSYQSRLINGICATAREIVLDGHKILAANTPVLISEVAGKLAVGRSLGACWFVTSQGKRVWSLRSAPDGVDVSQIAKAHGGGGHPHAAGFSEEMEDGPEAVREPVKGS